MKRIELAIVGAGPAGLSAAIEAARHGLEVVVFDENQRPGGQLFKQIHKFFGSKEHRAKERGYKIGQDLLKEAEALGVKVVLNTIVTGIFDGLELVVAKDDYVEHLRANGIIIATGANENMIPFSGWTLPGVMGAGAAQTMANLHGVRPGKNILMVGSGNVGVVVGLQLLQAGCNLKALIDASPHVGGYGVHASKIARTGVPFYLSHTIKEVYGTNSVEGAIIVGVDDRWQPIPGTEKNIEVDTVCMAVGLSPMFQLSKIAGCEIVEDPRKGGFVPVCDDYGATTVPGIWVAGDVSGIEEASSAMLGGKIAGAAAAVHQGYLQEKDFSSRFEAFRGSLEQLRGGQFGHKLKNTLVTHTEEGILLSRQLLDRGYLSEDEIQLFPGVPDQATRLKGMTPVIECTQNIPCDPCREACVKGCIHVSDRMTDLPTINHNAQCTGCGMCVAACPGQAIFLVDETYNDEEVLIGIPYEFYPLPVAGDEGSLTNRAGEKVGTGKIVRTQKTKGMDGTAVLWISAPKELSMTARFFKPLGAAAGREV
ncbi:FAD-dependent oxidoreductase [Desulfocicer niacini]